MRYLTTELISAIKRDAAIPTSQRRFENNDFLTFLNEELQLTIVGELLAMRQDYFVTTSDVPLVANQSEYDLPTSAVGWKLEAIWYVDTQGKEYRLPLITREQRGGFRNNQTAVSPSAIYVMDDKVETIPSMGNSVVGSLRYDYVRIQNELVLPSTCGLITAVNVDGGSISNCVDNGSGLIRVSVSGHGLTTGDGVTISGVSGTTEANGTFTVTVIDANTFDLQSSTFNNAYTSGGTATGLTYEITVETVPISSGDSIDVISGTNPYNVMARNVATSILGSIITVTYGTSFERAPVAGDYVAPVGKTPVPNIPEDFHSILAQAATLRCMIASNDTKGIQTQGVSLNNMLQRMRDRSSKRVHDAPRKIVPNNYILNLTRGIY